MLCFLKQGVLEELSGIWLGVLYWWGPAFSQVDNAKDFLSMGGLQLVIDGLNSTEAALKEHAAFVLGAALSRWALSHLEWEGENLGRRDRLRASLHLSWFIPNSRSWKLLLSCNTPNCLLRCLAFSLQHHLPWSSPQCVLILLVRLS